MPSPGGVGPSVGARPARLEQQHEHQTRQRANETHWPPASRHQALARHVRQQDDRAMAGGGVKPRAACNELGAPCLYFNVGGDSKGRSDTFDLTSLASEDNPAPRLPAPYLRALRSRRSRRLPSVRLLAHQRPGGHAAETTEDHKVQEHDNRPQCRDFDAADLESGPEDRHRRSRPSAAAGRRRTRAGCRHPRQPRQIASTGGSGGAAMKAASTGRRARLSRARSISKSRQSTATDSRARFLAKPASGPHPAEDAPTVRGQRIPGSGRPRRQTRGRVRRAYSPPGRQ